MDDVWMMFDDSWMMFEVVREKQSHCRAFIIWPGGNLVTVTVTSCNYVTLLETCYGPGIPQ